MSVSGDPGRCRSCNAEIVWTNEDGHKKPMNPDGVSHFATCPQADAWRKRAKTRAATAHLRDGKMPDELSAIDRAIRALPIPGLHGMFEGTVLTIKLVNGFELFNTRPYHNYETWSDGYILETHDGESVSAEDLDVAIDRLRVKLEARKLASKETPA